MQESWDVFVQDTYAEAMIDDLYRDWKEYGAEAIRAVRESRPAEYLKVVAMIVSKCTDLSPIR